MNVYGPVPSRRLGRSLGVDPLPAKICSYDCVYCQAGRTRLQTVARGEKAPAAVVVDAVTERMQMLVEAHVLVDHVTFVPDGEVTLDTSLGAALEGLHHHGYRTAVITNASLVGRADVREELMRADWVSLKLDAVDATTWRRINRPHPNLDFTAIQRGLREFADAFRGFLTTETMLVAGVNDSDEHARALADTLVRLRPRRAYLAVPTRPPAEPFVQQPDAETLTRFHGIVRDRFADVEPTASTYASSRAERR